MPHSFQTSRKMVRNDGRPGDTVAPLDVRWWRNFRVGMALLFWPLVIWVSIVTGGLIYQLVQSTRSHGIPGAAGLLDVMLESLPGFALGGICAGLGFGLPLGVVGILSRREKAVELAQSVEAPRTGPRAER